MEASGLDSYDISLENAPLKFNMEPENKSLEKEIPFGKHRRGILPKKTTPPKFNGLPLKNGGWKTILSYWEFVTFQGRTVKLPGCTPHFQSRLLCSSPKVNRLPDTSRDSLKKWATHGLTWNPLRICLAGVFGCLYLLYDSLSLYIYIYIGYMVKSHVFSYLF